MSKQKDRVTGIVALMIFAVVAMTAVSANSHHAREAAKSEFSAPSPSATPPTDNKAAGVNKQKTTPSATQPSKKMVDNVVATCNTAKGCERLRDACKLLKKHSFKATVADASLGVCIDQSRTTSTFFLRNSNSPNQPPKSPAAAVGLAAPKHTTEATIYCQGTLMCLKVQDICADLGGTYTSHDVSGSCEY